MQFDRYISLTVDGAFGSLDLSELRCRFDLHPLPKLAPSIGKIQITNLGPTKSRAIAQKGSVYKTVTIDAGYQDNHGVIFKGNIIQAISGRESPTDTLVTLIAADSEHGHNNAVVSTTHPPGSTPQDHFNTAIAALNPFNVVKGFVGPDLSTPVFPRAVTLYGMARDVLNRIAISKDARVFYDRQEVTMIERGGSRGGSATVLNSTSGLIGMPTQTPDGIFARCLINPSIRPGSLVQIDQKDIQLSIAAINPTTGSNDLGLAQLDSYAGISADGVYIVVRVDVCGDTRGLPWYMDLWLYARGGAPSQAQTLFGLPS
jgi:hypothetical protein